MGTHIYNFSLRKSSKVTKSLEPSYGFRIIGNLDSLLTRPSVKTFSRYYTCREVMVRDVRLRSRMNNLSEGFFAENALHLGVRMIGFQYNVVKNIIDESKEEKSIQSLEKVLEIILDNKVRILTGDVKSEPIPFPTTFYTKEKEYPSGGFLELRTTITKKHPENFMLKLSAILALLKEPKIVGKILESPGIDIPELVSMYLRLSTERFFGKDTSYFTINAVGNGSSQEFTENRIRQFLMRINNDDGSDYMSILYSALYLTGRNLASLNGDGNTRGPVDIVSTKGYSILDCARMRGTLISAVKHLPTLWRQELQTMLFTINQLRGVSRTNFLDTLKTEVVDKCLPLE